MFGMRTNNCRFAALLVAGMAFPTFAERPWVVVNEDNDHYFKNDISLDKEF